MVVVVMGIAEETSEVQKCSEMFRGWLNLHLRRFTILPCHVHVTSMVGGKTSDIGSELSRDSLSPRAAQTLPTNLRLARVLAILVDC